MSEGTIEILGQKLSYPTSWHGTVSVLIVCASIAIVAFLAVGWATPEALRALAGLNQASEQQFDLNQNVATQLETLYLKISALEEKLVAIGAPGDSDSDAEPSLSRASEAVEGAALDDQLAISRLREDIANQKLIRLQEVAPVVLSSPEIEGQVQQVIVQQQQQQQIQQDIQQKILQRN